MPNNSISIIQTSAIMLFFSLLITVVNCFFGYKLQRIWIGIICFFVGVVGGYAICNTVVTGVSVPVAILVGVALGALLVLLSWKFYLVGVFFFAAGSVFWACFLMLSDMNQLAAVAISVMIGLLVGFIAMKFTRITMILATSIGGGFAAAKSFLLLLPITALHSIVWLPIVCGSVLSILGVFQQYRMDINTRRANEQRQASKAARAAAREATTRASAEITPTDAPTPAHSTPVMPQPLPLEDEAITQDTSSAIDSEV